VSSNVLEIHSSKMKFDYLLKLIDKAIETNNPIQLDHQLYLQNNNTIKFLKWLEGHKIIKIKRDIKTPIKKPSIKSRKRKIEITLQLHALNVSLEEIAQRFNVKITTAQGYLQELGKYDKNYLRVLHLLLRVRGFSPTMELKEFPSFPIRVSVKSAKDNLSLPDFNFILENSHQNKWIKKVTGQTLGTTDFSILLPKSS